MVDETERLVLQMSADLSRLNKSVAAGQRQFDSKLLAMERRAQQADKNLSRIMSNAGRNMVGGLQSSLSSLAPTLAAAFSAQQVIKYADSYTGLQNRLKATGLEGERLKATETALYEIANRNGVAVAATSQLYQRASMARENLGASEEQLLKIVSGTSAALKLQGTSATEAGGALLQLGQLLGGNKVQAQEYNSLIDQLPTVLEAVAKGSDRWGGSVNKLTADVKAGNVTVKEWAAAMLKGFADIEIRAGGAALTVGAALQTLDNELGKFVGQADSGLSASARLAAGIVALSENLDGIAKTALAASLVIGTVLASRAIGGAAVGFTGLSARVALTNAQLLAFELQSGLAAGALGRMSVAGFAASGAMTRLNVAMSFFGGPIGLAITGLAAGIAILALNAGKAEREAASLADSIEEQAKAAGLAAEEVSALGGEMTATQSWAAALTGETDKLSSANYRLAASAKAAAIEQAKLRVGRAQTDLQAARKAFGERRLTERLRGGEGPINSDRARNAAENRTVQSPEFANLIAATRLTSGTVRQLADTMTGTLASRVEGARSPGVGGGGSATGGGKSGGGSATGGGRSGPTPEDLAAQREMLRLQAEVELLKAQGRDADATAIQRQIDLLNLTKQYQDAGFENAAAQAKTQIDAIAKAEDAAAAFASLQERASEGAEAFSTATEKEAEEARRRNDILLDRLGYEADLARLSGDPARIERAERELFIADRINFLLDQRKVLITEAQARAQAEGEYSERDATDRQGRMRDEFRQSFSEGIRAAIDGDLGGFFESMADRFTNRMLDNLADDLFDLLSEASKGFGGQGGTGGFASIIGGLFGKRASGGPVRAGQGYIVGERRPEVFVPNVNGTVIPSVNAAMNRASQGRGSSVVEFRQTINLEGANGDETIRQIAYDAAAQGFSAAVARSRADMSNMQRQQRQRFR